MKKFKFLLMFVSVLAITACVGENKKASAVEASSKTAETTIESEEITDKSAEIVGKWKVDFWHIEGAFEGGSFSADGIDMNNISVTFKADGTFVSNGEQFMVEATTNVNGNEFKNQFTNPNPFNKGTWEKTGDVLKVTNDGEPEVYEYHIDKLTAHKFESSLDDFDMEDESMEGNFKAKLGFTR